MTKTKTEVEVSFLTYQLTRNFWLLDFPTTNTSKNKNGTEVDRDEMSWALLRGLKFFSK